ncbi:hypothetical protein QP270_26350, partial [Escherichia coli]|nr:hypothetical protein [Escherichia coli]
AGAAGVGAGAVSFGEDEPLDDESSSPEPPLVAVERGARGRVPTTQCTWPLKPVTCFTAADSA